MNRFSRRAVACALLASTAPVALVATPAQAQTIAPAPVRSFVDGNGVDLFTGQFTASSPAIMIGDDETGVSFSTSYRGYTSGYNLLGRMWSSGSVYTVSIGSNTDKFTLSGSTFVPQEQNGSSLTTSGGLYTYTSSGGTVATFDTGCNCTFGNAAGPAMTSLTSPSGKKFTFIYRNGQYVVQAGQYGVQYAYGRRLQSVSSNTGYQMHFTYAVDDPQGQASQATPWSTLVTVMGINDLVDSCIVGVNSCTPNGTRPTLTISGNDFTDNLGRTTHFDWSAGGDGITGIRTPGNASNNISVAYTGGKATTVIANGISTSYSYVDSGNTRTTTVTNALGKSSVFTFDIAKSLLLSSRDPLNRTTTYTYDSNNRPVAVIQPEQNNVTYAYDARGNVITTTANAKPGSGLPVVQTSASYDATCTVAVKCNKPNSTTDARGNTTDYTYDTTHGGVLTVTAPAPTSGAVRPQVRYSYARLDGNGAASTVGIYRLATTSSCQTQSSCAGAADEIKSTINYGANQNVSSVSTGAGNGSLTATASFTYDAVGNKLTVDGPLAGSADTTRYRYDAGSRVVGIVSADPDGAGSLKNRAQRITYNAFGSVSQTEVGTVADQSDAAWNNFAPAYMTYANFDGYGRLIRDHSWSNNVHYTVRDHIYDALGREYCTVTKMDPGNWGPQATTCAPTQTTGPNGPDRVVENIYDDNGRVLQVRTNAGELEREVSYTPNGQIQGARDGENNLTTYEYDGFDRLAKTYFPVATKGANASNSGDYEQLTYDNNGNVVSKRLRDGQSVAYTYDNLGRVTFRDRPGSEPDATFTYDLLNRATGVSQPGYSMSIGYDALGRQTNENRPYGSFSRQFDLAGRLTRQTWWDGFYVDYTRLVTGELSQVRENGATSGPGVLASYYYDDLGRRTSLVRGNGVPTYYAYDAVSRLSGMTHDMAGTANDLTIGSMTYNPAGQMVSQTRSNDAYSWTGAVTVNRSYTSNGLNQYTAAGPTSFTYDARGNLTSDGSSTGVYDSANTLDWVTSNGSTKPLYYDPFGNLFAIDSPSSQRRFVVSGSEVAAETDASGNIVARFIRGDGADEVLVEYTGSTTSYKRWYHADERGSVIATSDGSGLLNVNTYDEYGIPGSGNSGTFQYTGQMWLPEIGMYNYKARIYSPTLGRFMQTDPIGYGDGMNMYGYVASDPVNRADPSGLDGVPSGEELDALIAAGYQQQWGAAHTGSAGMGGGDLMRSMSLGLLESQIAASVMFGFQSEIAGIEEAHRYNEALHQIKEARRAGVDLSTPGFGNGPPLRFGPLTASEQRDMDRLLASRQYQNKSDSAWAMTVASGDEHGFLIWNNNGTLKLGGIRTGVTLADGTHSMGRTFTLDAATTNPWGSFHTHPPSCTWNACSGPSPADLRWNTMYAPIGIVRSESGTVYGLGH